MGIERRRIDRRRIVDCCLLRSMNAWETDTAVRNASQSERPTPLDDGIGRGTLLARAVAEDSTVTVRYGMVNMGHDGQCDISIRQV